MFSALTGTLCTRRALLSNKYMIPLKAVSMQVKNHLGFDHIFISKGLYLCWKICLETLKDDVWLDKCQQSRVYHKLSVLFFSRLIYFSSHTNDCKVGDNSNTCKTNLQNGFGKESSDA